MPTNPRWLEHTERAAWDTVQTLRQQVETERARVEQLVRMQGSWPKMLEVVARVRDVHAITGDDPVAVVEQLSAELLRVKQEHTELSERLRVDRMQQEHARLVAVLDLPQRVSADAETLSGSFRGFVERVKDRAAHTASKPHRSYERLLGELEYELDELEQAPRRERYEHAVALACLAWRVAQSLQDQPPAEEA